MSRTRKMRDVLQRIIDVIDFVDDIYRVSSMHNQKNTSPMAENSRYTNYKNVMEIRLTGVSYGNRQEVIGQMSIKDKIHLLRDAGNVYDRNAVAVCLTKNGKQIGYLPRQIAADLAPRMDKGEIFPAEVKSISDGRNRKLKGVIIRIYISGVAHSFACKDNQSNYSSPNAEKTENSIDNNIFNSDTKNQVYADYRTVYESGEQTVDGPFIEEDYDF
jgi:hypothetical protein